MFTYASFELNLQEISTGPLNQCIGSLIDWAFEQRRPRALLQAAGNARPACEVLQLAVGNCTTYLNQADPLPWYTAPEPFEARILRGKRALFNRDGLRESIRELLAPDGANVLVVRGVSRQRVLAFTAADHPCGRGAQILQGGRY